MAKRWYSYKEVMSGIPVVQVLYSLGNRGDANRWIGWLGLQSGWKSEKVKEEGKCRQFGTDIAKQIYVDANYFSFPQE